MKKGKEKTWSLAEFIIFSACFGTTVLFDVSNLYIQKALAI